jgi:hypothetical protein
MPLKFFVGDSDNPTTPPISVDLLYMFRSIAKLAGPNKIAGIKVLREYSDMYQLDWSLLYCKNLFEFIQANIETIDAIQQTMYNAKYNSRYCTKCNDDKVAHENGKARCQTT